MFVKLKNDHALCIEAYKDVQKKAIVPPVNELWVQVMEWVDANGWHEMTDREVTDFLKPILSTQQEAIEEHQWVKSELKFVDDQLKYHWTGDQNRITYTEQVWKDYAIALRDYTSTDADGNPIMTGESRPSIDNYL